MKEHIWRFVASWQIFIFSGDETGVLLTEGQFSMETRVSEPWGKDQHPWGSCRDDVSADVDISWLLRQRAAETFSLDRQSAHCRTPARNPEIDGARTAFAALRRWFRSAADWLAFSPELKRISVSNSPAQSLKAP